LGIRTGRGCQERWAFIMTKRAWLARKGGMPNIDLEKLSGLLTTPAHIKAIGEFESLLQRSKGPFCWESVAREPWEGLVFEVPDRDRLHENTIARLTGPVENYRLPEVTGLFRELESLEPDFISLIGQLRDAVTGLGTSFRTGPMWSEAGYLCKVSVFQSAKAVMGALKVAEQFRNSESLHHPLWNALLLQLLCLRIHPFSDGNGRSFRALVSYELYRSGSIVPTIIPTKKVLDANRPYEIRTRAAVTNAVDKKLRTEAVADALLFDVRVLNCSLSAAIRSA